MNRREIMLGVDYYPEHWPKERWKTDAEMMKELGIEFVRLAEFSWSKLEPEKGVYDFKWLDDAIDTLSEYGLKIVLGTPTAAPPIWLVREYPEILPVDSEGHVMGPGGRRYYCYNSPIYRELTKVIVTKMAEHYKSNPHIIGWQIDNEFGCHESNFCYCDNCLKAFQKWLRRKYKTIENLNKAWGTVFWSGEYHSWDEVIIPRKTVALHNPSLLLNYRRFVSDSIVEYQRIQVEILKNVTPDKFVTHNFMGLFGGVDYYKLSKDLDFVSWDNYPKTIWGYDSKDTALAHDVMRGVKEANFWIMEEQSGSVGWPEMAPAPLPGEIRLWTYQAIAHGADAIFFFRWRTSNIGAEQFWHGILDYDGIPRRRYKEIKKLSEELGRIKDRLKNTIIKNDVALVYSYDIRWAWETHPSIPKLDYMDIIKRYYKALFEIHVPVDVINPEKPIPTHYKLVLAPMLYIVNEDILKNLERYVKNGGKLILTFRSGVKNWDNVAYTEALPGPLRKLVGGYIYEYSALDGKHKTQVRLSQSAEFSVEKFCESLIPEGSDVIAYYSSGIYESKPAILKNKFSSGEVVYVGANIDCEGIKEIILSLLPEDKKIFNHLPSNVEIYFRQNDRKKFIFIMNHSAEGKTLETGLKGRDILQNESVSNILSIDPFGVKIIEMLG